ncbi:Uncharacterized protein SAPIO_CDS6833 [Scedosporium apiospermum]|uniref:Rhamnogalacturonase A/B/Epimerase-like pectate lyase domain-containing protein n=1 Tax=Pseudallescheria apiosperma TaxID=563466 RepID=A0A084G2W0_PSEDA|nr:Uncharacterized protein SAPIO_CDS6833 [Scedosporium apiospermum]KEZ41672.1 Uncharacterized protein SAPIO_CDS6833 [Scedosporium apiospermum]
MAPFWRKDTASTPNRVIDIWPEVVFLEYNCFYMRDICKNSENWFATPKGMARVPRYRFGYDFNTGKSNSFRSAQRRSASCPSSWKRNHVCPETDQLEVMRHDGQWPHNDLEPNTNVNQIRSRMVNGRLESSQLRYTCDEFPPATWIEGGSGFDSVEARAIAAETRCAAFRCGKGVKSEQNWQATAHLKLQHELKAVVDRRHRQFPFYQAKDSVALFMFRTTNVANGYAAKIYTYKDASQSGQVHDPVTVSQAKRAAAAGNETAEREAFWEWADTVTMEELVAMGPSRVREDRVFANVTICEVESLYDASGAWMNFVGADLSGPMSPRPRHETTKKARDIDVTTDQSVAPLAKTASSSDLARARAIVEEAILKSAELNTARLEHPLRNKYSLHPGTVIGGSIARRHRRDEVETVPPLLKITDEIAAAAALVSEADALKLSGNIIKRRIAPYADDTKAIKAAINDQKQCSEKCDCSTIKNAIVYFPPGNYRVSSTIPVPFGTQIIGDANSRPTIVATRNFIGLGVLSVNEYTGGGTGPDGLDQQWYVNTANFYRQLRNVVIDITQTRAVQKVAGLHYQVAQATSIQNVEIIAAPGSTQMGIFAENGSGGVISDITFRGGQFGIYGGNQQFTAQRLQFIGCDTGVRIIWDWGWIWKSITMTNVRVGFQLLTEKQSSNTKRQTVPGKASEGNEKPGSGSSSVIIEHVNFQGIGKAVADTSGATLLQASGTIDYWALGPVHGAAGTRDFSRGGKIGSFRRVNGLLDDQGNYFERAKPQYEDRALGDFVQIRDVGAKGDGVTDDTAAFQSALYASQGKILFVDAGSNPKVMVRVGSPGNVGDVEMQDLIFTNRGATAGLILLEWNIRAASPGSAGLWDCHVRIGGATGTELTPDECPALRSGIAPGCNAGSLMMYITLTASGYFENMWLWVADHDIDDPDLVDANNTMVQKSVYFARGLLVESVEPTWLYGTSSEHAVFYQYNFHRSRNIFAGMIQTESPYYQPTPPPPAPFEDAVGKVVGDPSYVCQADDEFSGCDESWAVIMRECANIFVAGAGLYSWFSTYTQECIDEHACQKALMLLDDNFSGVRFQNLITIGAKYMAIMDGVGINATDYLNVESHPRWSQISVLDVQSNGAQYDEKIWIDPKIWDMEQPAFTCSPPCLVNIPPWTKATRVVNYPKITVSDGDWTTTVTAPPVTITQLLFEVVTLARGGGNRRRAVQDFTPFWPKPATTPYWPPITFTDRQGNIATTAAAVAFPAPPDSIGPDAPPPEAGQWPKRWIEPWDGLIDDPFVQPCYWTDFGCFPDPFRDYNPAPDPGDDFDENWEDASVTCPAPSSTTTASKTTVTQEPEPSPTETWEKATNGQLSAASNSFCRSLGDEGVVLRVPAGRSSQVISRNYEPPANGQWPINIDVSLEIRNGCEFTVNYNQCMRYLKVPIDSCDCGGINGKQGGWVANRCYTWRIDPQTF